MKCAIMQPTYMPWIGYFSLIDSVDMFVFLDNVKLEKHSWHVRNQIKTANKTIYITVPVNAIKGRLNTLINEALIENKTDWRTHHLRSIFLAYKKSAHFDSVYPFLEKLIRFPANKLAELNTYIITNICQQIGIKTKFIIASHLTEVAGTKDDRLVAICQTLKCDAYISPVGSAVYINKEKVGGKFPENKINLLYQNYHHPVYNQLFGNFVSHMSIIDLLFNYGFSDSLDIIKSGRKNEIDYNKL